MNEAALVRRIIIALEKKVGGFWVKIHGGPFQRAGIPDIIGCCEGRFFGFEVKLPKKENNLTKLQQHILTLINQAGGCAIMVTTPDEALRAVSEKLKK